eukprot:TRINITY_DN5028_c0_g1_i3.p2 TRINITY_DN5028_c0_g1~~TRINITY_DN5028_c0_g1_i3.p2  ORF type:complete len:171 (-),score=22.76 TRINITY_DN5028_c0_g1_i3:163-675(-)
MVVLGVVRPGPVLGTVRTISTMYGMKVPGPETSVYVVTRRYPVGDDGASCSAPYDVLAEVRSTKCIGGLGYFYKFACANSTTLVSMVCQDDACTDQCEKYHLNYECDHCDGNACTTCETTLPASLGTSNTGSRYVLANNCTGFDYPYYWTARPDVCVTASAEISRFVSKL